MKRKLIACLLTLATLAALSGCQLAKEEVQGGRDYLVGVCITNEYLDLLDMKAYLEDHWNGQTDMTITGDTRAYENRIYGQDISGDPTHPEYVFPGVDGVVLWNMPIEDENGEICWTPSDTPEAPFHTAYKITDEMDTVVITADLYVDCNQRDHSFYANPIYRTPEGEVYLISASGLSGDMSQPGTRMGTDLTEETTITIGDQTSLKRTEIHLNFYSVEPVTEVVLVQMDEDHQVLAQEAFPAGEIPDSCTPLGAAAYLVVESHHESEVTRALYGRGEETITLYTGESKGYFIQETMTIQW